jgi:hypothetical protein
VIRIDVGEIGWGCVKWMQLVQDKGRWRAVVNAVMNLRFLVPLSYLIMKELKQTNCIRFTSGKIIQSIQ